MTQKDYVLAQIDFIKTMLGSVVLGGLVGVDIYIMQSQSFNVSILGFIAILVVVAYILQIEYEKLLDELKGLP